jgi:peroxin-5
MQNGPMSHVLIDPQHAGVHLRASSTSPAWANDFQNSQAAAMESAFKVPQGTQFSPEDFARFHQMNQPASSSRSSPMPSVVGQRSQMMGGGSMMNMGYGMMTQPSPFYSQQIYHPPAPMQQQQQQSRGKGKEKVAELDDTRWEEQFKELELHDKQVEEDEALAAEEELSDLDKGMQSETNEFGDFESIWNGIQAETAAAKSMVDGDAFDSFDNDFSADFQGLGGDWSRLGDPLVENYLFEEDNLFNEDRNAFDEGVRIMREGGNLSLAALAFEAAVQQNPEHVDAWVYLGTAQAQNEKESAAIRALTEARRLDPNNLDALMGLAISYTNEGYDSTAYRILETWLSVKYPQVLAPTKLTQIAEVGFTEKHLLHEKVTDHFIRAAQLSPHGMAMDPDVQVGLGVLFYGAEEYDKAVDCFQAALHSSELGTSNQQEQLHLLWNRLGATLANSGRSEEAIAAYERALSLRPNFVRARYNLGVSCINIGCQKEAAAHFLAALDMHKSIEKSGRKQAREILGGGGSASVDERIDRMMAQNSSTTLYDTLRRVFTQMGRRDLADKTIVGVDPDIFRPEFDF